jgi:hypothetical protein
MFEQIHRAEKVPMLQDLFANKYSMGGSKFWLRMKYAKMWTVDYVKISNCITAIVTKNNRNWCVRATTRSHAKVRYTTANTWKCDDGSYDRNTNSDSIWRAATKQLRRSTTSIMPCNKGNPSHCHPRNKHYGEDQKPFTLAQSGL